MSDRERVLIALFSATCAAISLGLPIGRALYESWESWRWRRDYERWRSRRDG